MRIVAVVAVGFALAGLVAWWSGRRRRRDQARVSDECLRRLRSSGL